MYSVKDHTLVTALRQGWTVPVVKMTSGCVAVLFISHGRIPLAPTLDNSDPLLSVLITPGFYLHPVKVQMIIDKNKVLT